MTDNPLLTKDEYDRLMHWCKIGRHLGESGAGWAESLWDRHAATVPQDDVERGAVHEAGHAVVAHACGWTPYLMKLLPDGSGSTESFAPEPMCLRMREMVFELHHTAMVESAGLAAEEMAYGMARYPDRAWFSKVQAVWEVVQPHLSRLEPKLLAMIPPPIAHGMEGRILAFVDEGERRCRWVLERNQPTLQSVADAILEARTLGEVELGRLFADVIAEDGLHARE